ncbi:DNA-binding transcriptional response regulator, NtrC family, contains REC, AAA-type ATPase, and a Fis-type DNA-binding domains [Desulfonauticus submarinus]|uniref:DNA-binding transcriptional response regulator, NtrC family, contains REC, AAA-type ATPase, and a Fis-type DNA-binding domains n=1 Tax=Desulfonauticus submarinus TaxID=206665 RepID=A0A1H0D864_9BACT|nr:sigma-54 dependent transcriptional regulator [Desulfonauticus submarinus]SDN66305.1 DNA-binding transcriptional response regulator, NtrC family, contains REC, AAA-type ATPase, and a Fis-type DNA-binding domains [Desulfonauticus submarinus]
MQVKVLLIEDELSQREILQGYLKEKNFTVLEAASGREGLDLALEVRPDLILLDYKLPDMDGLEVLIQLKKSLPLTPVIIITAFGSVEMAVSALKQGAYHYLTKPIKLQELLFLMQRALKEKRLEEQVAQLKSKLGEIDSCIFDDIIAESVQMKSLFALVKKVAATDATVLILGESGTGKEVVANLVYKLSERKQNSFVKINCAAIPLGLLESELFGHERGAFTGATKTKQGLFETANRGTIFLDEIGDMPLELQAKLLRVLQDGTFTRVGGTKEIKVDVRVIAATNKDLERLVKEGKFREDLFWRLNVFTLRISPLRERKEDILPLAQHFCQKFAKKYQKKIKGISKKASEMLFVYPFWGNVRELENIIERAVIVTENELLSPEDFPEYVSKSFSQTNELFTLPLPKAIEKLEYLRIKEALEESKGVKTKAAKLLGISERTLRYKLEKFNQSIF